MSVIDQALRSNEQYANTYVRDWVHIHSLLSPW
jgi:hypothetical protein